VGRIPHRHLGAVGDDLELRRRIVLEAHSAGPADIERALDHAAVGIALHEPRLQRADRIDVAFDVRNAGLGLGARGGKNEGEAGGEGSEQGTHGRAYDD